MRSSLYGIVGLLLMIGCTHAPGSASVQRPRKVVRDGDTFFSSARAATPSGDSIAIYVDVSLAHTPLSAVTLCDNSQQAPSSAKGTAKAQSCIPCDLPTLKNDPDGAARRAEQLWDTTGHAPFLDGDLAAHCIRSLWQRAVAAKPGDRAMRLNLARFRLSSGQDEERALAWATWDALADTLLLAHDSASAASVIADAGDAVWNEALTYLQRVNTIAVELSDEENANRALTRGAGRFVRLPAANPKDVTGLGFREAQYAQALFRSASALQPHDTYLTRLTLMPYVWLRQWSALDSTAAVMLGANAMDSVAWSAHALAVFNTDSSGKYTVAAFDSALRYMPRADSIRYDNLDAVLSHADAQLRFELPVNEQRLFERRTWELLDPLWITPVNEVRLASLARTTEADLLYASVAGRGASGAETPLGTMLRRKGPPDLRWQSAAPVMLFRPSQRLDAKTGRVIRGWPGATVILPLSASPEPWRLFHLATTSLDYARREASPDGSCKRRPETSSIYGCALANIANFSNVSYATSTDSIDVHTARFRFSDSANFYVAARVRKRIVPDRSSRNSAKDSVLVVNWIKTPTGELLKRNDVTFAPNSGKGEFWTLQWRTPLETNAFMHRVEAYSKLSRHAARGVAVTPSNENILLPSVGFGLSDILVADSISELHSPARSWRDLNIVPDAGVVPVNGHVDLAWEVYDLKPDENGHVLWSYSIVFKDASNVIHATIADVISGRNMDSRPASEKQAPTQVVTRNEAASKIVVDHFRLRVGNAVPGRYVLMATINDLVAHKSVARDVSVRVEGKESPQPPVRRRR